MRVTPVCALIGAVVAVVAAMPVASTATATTAPDDVEIDEEELQAILDDWRADRDFAVTPSVRVPGHADVNLASGLDDRDADGTYGIASVTKSFTTAVALQLVDEGRLSLDAPVEPWLPELPNADRITLAMLLGHTSGLADEPGQPPVGEPDESFAYSSAGFEAVGQLIERELDQDFAAVIEERLTGPLSLDDTLLSSASPAFGMISSSADLLDWGEALYSGTLLGADATATMLEMRNSFLGFYGLGTMGLCLEFSGCTPDNVEFFGHSGVGGVDGSITVLAHHRDTGTTAVAHASVDDIGVLVSMIQLVVDSLHHANAGPQS